MKNAPLTPCANWVARLTSRNYDELCYTDSLALHEHLAMCAACATAYATYQNIGKLISCLPSSSPSAMSTNAPLKNFNDNLLQCRDASISRKEHLIANLIGKLMHLKSLFIAFMLLLQRVDYASDDHFCYALRDTSGFLLWRYKKSDVFFSTPAVKDGVPYIRASDTPLFQFAARVRPCNNSFLWKC